MKTQILEALGFAAQQQFPVYADRFPIQMLAYLRLARVADPALFAKVWFRMPRLLLPCGACRVGMYMSANQMFEPSALTLLPVNVHDMV